MFSNNQLSLLVRDVLHFLSCINDLRKPIKYIMDAILFWLFISVEISTLNIIIRILYSKKLMVFDFLNSVSSKSMLLLKPLACSKYPRYIRYWRIALSVRVRY